MATPSTTTTTSTRCTPVGPNDALRVGFEIIWAVGATRTWLPGFRAGYLDTIRGSAASQPGRLKPWFDFWTNLQSPHPDPVAAAETLILGFARKPTYLSAVGFSPLAWAPAERFGGPYTSGSAIGTAHNYPVLCAGLLAPSYYTEPVRHSADYYLGQRLAWW